MAATGYTPIQLYYSTTASATPAAGNLLSGELAINITDGKLYYKDNAGAVQLLSTSTTATGTANGVLYLNGSKVATSGSALTFDGTSFSVGETSAGKNIKLYSSSAGNNGLLRFYDTGNTERYQLAVTTSLVSNYAPASTNYVWYIDSEAMRLTSTGLGIGTSLPAYKLDVNGAGRIRGDVYAGTHDGNNKYYFERFAAGLNAYLTSGSADNNASQGFIFQCRNADGVEYNAVILNGYSGTSTNAALTLDSSGNLGLGFTPSAWGSGLKAFQASTASFMGDGTATYVSSNWYYNGGNKYIGNGYATSYQTYSGQHVWFTAGNNVSGAGAAISFNQAMTLDASGNWMNGTTTAIGRATVVGGGTSQLAFHDGNGGSSNYGYLNYGGNSGELTLNANSSGGSTLIRFLTSNSGSNAERARIDSSGNLLINSTSSGSLPGDGYVFIKSASTQYIGHASGTASGTGYLQFWYNGSSIGSVTQSGTTAVLYNITSDQRLKENIADADSASSLIDALQVRKFDWKADGNHQRYGFVAQELVTVAPEAVHQPADPEQMMAVDYSKLVPMLVKEIQSLRARVAALES